MRIERISGVILILLSGVLLLMAAYGGTPEDRDCTPRGRAGDPPDAADGSCGTVHRDPGARQAHQARLPGVKPATLTN